MFIGRSEWEEGSYIGEKQIGYCKVTFFQWMAGIYQEDYLPSAD